MSNKSFMRSPLRGYLHLFLAFQIAEAIHSVVVYHPHGLHVGVTDRWADELEAAAEQVFAHRDRFLRLGGNFLYSFPGIHFWLAAHELPDIGIETAELFDNFEKGTRVLDGGFDLAPVTDDPGVGQQLLHFRLVVLGNFV